VIVRSISLALFLAVPTVAAGAPLILNEYNAVSGSRWLNGGDQDFDEDCTPEMLPCDPAADSFFGRVEGNGGDWFELVVVADGLDIRGWQLAIRDEEGPQDTLVVSQHEIWSQLRAGTIITVAEDLPPDVDYHPEAGDWWIHVQASNDVADEDAIYITNTNFPVNNDDWQLTILDEGGRVVYGPAGEGISPSSGVGGDEVFKLETDPSALITPDSLAYQDGKSSTFGAPNQFSGGMVQDFSALRDGTPLVDQDFDGISDCTDNCRAHYNPLQENGNDDAFGDRCDADYDDDGAVGLDDFNRLRAEQGKTEANPDFDAIFDADGNGEIDLADLPLVVPLFGGPPGPGPEDAAACALEDPTVAVFDPERLLEIEIQMAPEDWDALRSTGRRMLEAIGPDCDEAPAESPFEFFPATVTIDGVTLESVGVRKKGFLGSLDRQRPSLKVKFSEFVDGQRFEGMERLTLNNNLQDPSHVKQCIGYYLMAEAGVPASRCNFAHVVVNGVDLGVYSNVDSIKDPFLVRNFGSASGNLYEGTQSDFREGYFDTFEFKNNDDGSDLLAVAHALMASDAELLGRLWPLVDIPAFITFWAMEGIIGHWDGYSGNANNFWLYHDPTTGLFQFIPWGIDGIMAGGNPFFGVDEVDAPAVNLGSLLTKRLYDHPVTRPQMEARLIELRNTLLDGGGTAFLEQEVDRIDALLSPVLDARGEDNDAAVATVRAWLSRRAQTIDAEIAAGFPDSGELLPRFCLEPVGSLSARFDTSWGNLDGIPTILSVGEGDFDVVVNGQTVDVLQRGALSGFGEEPYFPGKPVILPLAFFFPNTVAYAFPVHLEEEQLIPGETVLADDRFHNVVAVFNAFQPQLPSNVIAQLVDASVSFDAVSTLEGAPVGGRVEATIAAFLPAETEPIPPPPESAGGCGLGFELALVLPGLLWLRARQRRWRLANRGRGA